MWCLRAYRTVYVLLVWGQNCESIDSAEWRIIGFSKSLVTYTISSNGINIFIRSDNKKFMHTKITQWTKSLKIPNVDIIYNCLILINTLSKCNCIDFPIIDLIIQFYVTVNCFRWFIDIDPRCKYRIIKIFSIIH